MRLENRDHRGKRPPLGGFFHACFQRKVQSRPTTLSEGNPLHQISPPFDKPFATIASLPARMEKTPSNQLGDVVVKKLFVLLLAAALCLGGCSAAKGGEGGSSAPSAPATSSSASSSSRVSSSASSSQVSSSSQTSSAAASKKSASLSSSKPVSSAAATSQPPSGSPAPAAPPSSSAAPATDPQQSVTVYVTKTGEKYHRAGCQYLKKSCIPISLDDAKRSYSPCSKCNPPR